MQKFLSLSFFTLVIVLLFAGCKKNKKEPLVIIPTINPLPYSVMVYYITPTDKTFNADYYSGIKACALSLQNWYKDQMGNGKTFLLNPVVVDTLTGLHNSAWFNSNNGPDISGSGGYAYHNTLYEIKQLLGTNFNITNNLYFVFVASDFPDETIPRGLAAEGLSEITRLAGSNPNQAVGDAGHALGHAFGLPEVNVINPNAIMSTGYPQYPNCVLQQPEKDSLNASPFFTVHL